MEEKGKRAWIRGKGRGEKLNKEGICRQMMIDLQTKDHCLLNSLHSVEKETKTKLTCYDSNGNTLQTT